MLAPCAVSFPLQPEWLAGGVGNPIAFTTNLNRGTSIPSHFNFTITPQPLSTLTVTNTNDSGPGSLRQAISSANSGDTISFTLPAGSIITLTSGELLIQNKNLAIVGPGAHELTIQRSTTSGTPQFRIFHVTSNSGGNFTVSISGVTISNGSVSSLGGGLESDGTTTVNVIGCTISGNAGGVVGGGIASLGTALNVTNTTIAQNSAPSGGGLYAQNSALNVLNTTITANFANNGGGMNVQLATVGVTNATIVGNSAPFGGGVFIHSSSIASRNTIIAANTGSNGPDVHTSSVAPSQLTSNGFNLIGNNSGASIASQPTDQIGTSNAPLDPLLGVLSDNGGATHTRAPLTGSPAIDKGGTATGITTDQRGLTRPINNLAIPNAVGGDGSDIGAFELQPAESIPGPTTDSITYTYDSLNRLQRAEYASGSAINYTYDAAGNRTALQTVGIGVSANTVVGNNVVTRGLGVTAKFTTVTTAGSTSITPESPGSVGSLPNGFHLFDDAAVIDISTTATIQGLIRVCFSSHVNTDSLTFARLRILHNENGVWVNRTTTSDFNTLTVCSSVSSLGGFAVVLLGPPTALQDSTSNRAAAINSVTSLRDPVTVIDTHNFSVDQRARLVFFVQSVDLLPAENLSLVTAQARDVQGVTYALPVESVVKVPNVDWLSEVIVKLSDSLIGKGDVQVSVTVRGIQSQPVTVRVQ
ncbi:MAG TPA: choice-of-anchor Q domain-containing protein [Pyrinomonadaceae bacterium]|nr:choice-of-anchor Q domain-containing protein [Pyrinomonadaceae bacterium]